MKILGVLLANLLLTVVMAQDEDQTLLWKIEKEGVGEAYLFGTIHVLPQNEFNLDEKVRRALYESDELVMELDLTDPGMQAKMMELASMNEGMTLDKLMDEEEYAMIDKKLRAVMGTPLSSVNTFKPFMVSTFLLGEYVGSQPASFELALMSMASQRNMPISALESLEDQMAVFDSIPYEAQVEDLLMMVRDSVEMRDLFVEMIAEYKSEDLEGLYETTEEYFDSEQEMRLLLYERNAKWMDIIENRIGEKTLFIAVGAAHLGGEMGLVKQLNDRGLIVSPIFD